MKKTSRWLVLLSLVLFMGVFAACSGSDSEEEGNNNAQGNSESKETVKLSVWLTPQWKGVFDPTEDGADYDSFLKHAAEEFIKQYDKYEVEIDVEVIASDQRDELLNVNLSSGTPPDIFFENTFAMEEFVHRGAILPITDLIDDEDHEDIDEGFLEAVTFGDDIYFYPFQHMPGTLVYNADMLRDAGLEDYIGAEDEIKTWTIEELEDILYGVKENLPTDKYTNAYPMALFAVNNQGDTWNLAYLRMFGNEFFDENGNIVFNDEKGVESLEWLKKIYDEGLTNPGAESVSSNDALAMFQNQQLAVSFTNSVLFNNKKADMDNGEAPEFDMRLANVPSISGDPLTFTYVTGASVFDTGDEKRIEVSKDFVKFFSSNEELVKASKNGVPVRSSVAEHFKDENPLFAAYDENAQYLFDFTGSVPGYNQLREVLYPELQALFTGEKTPEEAAKSYEEKGNEVIEESRADSVIHN